MSVKRPLGIQLLDHVLLDEMVIQPRSSFDRFFRGQHARLILMRCRGLRCSRQIGLGECQRDMSTVNVTNVTV